MSILLSRSQRPEGHLAEAYWRMRLGELGTACCISEPAGEADGIREAFHLLMLAPPGMLSRRALLSGEERIEAMLAAGAAESAALSLLPQGSGYMLSRGGNGEHVASVFLAGSDCEMTAQGTTAALALVAALMAELSHSAGVLHSASLN
jgi:hypothetical protein